MRFFACIPLTGNNLSPTPTLGAIAGIVLAIIAFVVIAIAVAIIVAIVVYKLRTGKWFKLKYKDDDNLTMDIDMGLLTEEGAERQNMGSLKRMFSGGKANVSACIP